MWRIFKEKSNYPVFAAYPDGSQFQSIRRSWIILYTEDKQIPVFNFIFDLLWTGVGSSVSKTDGETWLSCTVLHVSSRINFRIANFLNRTKLLYTNPSKNLTFGSQCSRPYRYQLFVFDTNKFHRLHSAVLFY
jgi:hypothetical protein